MSTAAAPDLLRSLDPATGEEVGRLPLTPVESIAGMVRTARGAQGEWGALALEERVRRLRPAAAALAAGAKELGELIMREMGKPSNP